MNNLPEACYRVSVKGIYQDEEGRYMLSIKDGSLGLVGGGLEHGETYYQALIREVKEETNLEVITVSRSPDFFTTLKSNKHIYRAIILYRIDIKNISEFLKSDECDEIRFYSAQELKSIDGSGWLRDSGWIDSL